MQAFPYADKETISALSQAVGALAGGAAGGDLAQIALSMGISKNAVENNRLLNAVELARIKELSNGDVVREAELTAAACALVKCSAGFAEGSVERAEWAAIEALGSTPEALDDRQWLKVQVQPGYLYTAGNGVATQEQLFDYAFTDYLFDWGSRNQAGVRAFGGLQAVGGAAQAAGGIAISPSCASIIGCVGAGFLIASGYDNAVAGTSTLFTGKPAATWGGQAFQAAGISPDVAELLYALTQVGAGSVAMMPKPKPSISEASGKSGGAAESGAWNVDMEAGTSVPVTDRFLLTENRVKKIFGTREGHIPDTPQNRNMVRSLANDPGAYLGTDNFGNAWMGKQMPDGTQLWLQTRGGIIWNAGVNKVPAVYNPRTGLAAPVKPTQLPKVAPTAYPPATPKGKSP